MKYSRRALIGIACLAAALAAAMAPAVSSAAARAVSTSWTAPDAPLWAKVANLFAATAALPQTFVVTNTADTGPGSLRQAILDANAKPGADIISFNIPGAGPHKIQPLSPLPYITSPVLIDGYTQPESQMNSLAAGTNAVIQIQIDGMLMNAGAGDGLAFAPGATTDTEASTVRGLSITRFRQGIFTYAPHLSVTGNFLGIEPDGLTPQGNDFSGVYVQAPGAIIGTNGDGVDDLAERNLLSGNYGVNNTGNVRVHNTNAAIIAGNLIGTDRTGTLAKPTLTPSRWSNNVPCVNGIMLESAHGVRIGTNGDGIADAAERNVISGHTNNAGCGVGIGTWLSNNAVVAGNLIGTDVTGTLPIPNWHGVSLGGYSENGRVGTDGNGVGDAAERNVISASQSVGVHITLTHNGHLVAGNFIGTDITGTRALGNLHGVYSTHGSYNIRVGGTTPALRNIISGNSNNGVWLNDATHSVLGNYIGTDVTGSQAVPNGFGVNLSGNTIVGNGQPGGGNLVSGNSGHGVYMVGSSGNKVQGNLIGTDAAGTRKLPNGGSGVYITGSKSNLIGGSSDAERNVISGNAGPGVTVQHYSLNGFNAPSDGNTVEGNLIGTDRGATLRLGNSGNGVDITLSTATRVARNTIVDNTTGIAISSGATDSVITSNYIGTTEARGSGFGNRSHGIDIRLRSSRNSIGDGTAGGGNVIAHNTGNGVTVADPGYLNDFSRGNLISANSIFNNGQLGINLTPDNDSAVTANDSLDPDEGANRMQNHPVTPSSGGGSWTLNSTPNTLFLIEFFGNAQPDASGSGEGQVFLGTTTVTTDASGNATFMPALAYDPAHTHISATATDPQNNTSEFSGTVQAQAPPATCSATVNVPGTSNPYLAGMPAGSTDNGWDSVPANSPVLVSGLPITAGATYTFSATGTVHLGDNNLAPPDGFAWYSNLHNPSNGIGGYRGPANALLGVFLADSAPNSTSAPAQLDMYAAGFDNANISPALKQVFFIGDGKTSLGATQTFVAPAGATRLYLATLDGYGWYNNGGSFNVTASSSSCHDSSTPPPAITTGPAEGSLVGPGLPGQPGVVRTTFGGTGNAGCTVRATVNDPDHGNVGTYTATVDANGNWSMDFDLHDCDPVIEFVQICGGVESEVVRRHIYVDGTPPEFTGGGPAAEGTIYIGGGSTTGTILIDGSASDPNTYHCAGGNCGGVTYEWYLIGSGGSRTLLGGGGSGGTLVNYTGGPGSGLKIELGAGEYEFEIVVIDGAGNRLVRRCRRRVVQPQPLAITGGLPEDGGTYGPGTAGAPGRVRRTITGTGSPGCRVDIKVSDPSHPDSTRNNQTYSTTVGGDGRWSLDLELDDCHPVVEIVQVCDGAAGNTIRRQIYVDGTPPVFTGGGPADGFDYAGSGGTAHIVLNGAAGDEDTHVPGGGVGYEWHLLGGGGTRTLLGGGGSAGTLTGGGSGLEIDLQPGSYDIEVKVCDRAGNCITKVCHRVVRRPLTLTGGLPETGGIMGPGTGYTVVGDGGRVKTRLTGRGEPGCTVEVKISDPTHPHSARNNATYTTTVDSSGNWSLDLELDDCHPVIEIRQVCEGEAGAVIRRQVYIDTTPPTAGLSDQTVYVGAGGTATARLDPGAADPHSHVPGNGLTYRWYLVGDGVRTPLCENCTGVYELVGGPGEYVVEVEITDSAGNVTTKRCKVVVLKRPTEIVCASNSVDFAGLVTLNYTLKDKLTGEVLVRTIKYKLNGNEVPATFEAYLLPGTYQVVAEFAGDEIYQSCSSGGGCPLEVRSTPGKITGGGSIDERVRNFGFVVQTKSQGGSTIYTGHVEYQDKAAGYNLRSQSVTVIAVSADRRRGLFAGTAVVNGVPGYTFTVWVDDLAEPGAQVDKFRIQISGPGGFAYDSNDHATLEGKLDQGGNIQIHKAN